MTTPLELAKIRMANVPSHLNMVTLNRQEMEAVLAALATPETSPSKAVEGLLMPYVSMDLEALRREKPSLDATPLTAVAVDYAQAGTKIDKAIHHLDEGLPIGQRVRGAAAYALLYQGVQELGIWLAAKGYFDEAAAKQRADTALAREVIDEHRDTLAALAKK